MKKHLLVLHPFLFTLFPILSLYTDNLGEIPFVAIIRAMVVGLACVGVLLVLLRWLLKDWNRAGVVATLEVLLIFLFGHTYNTLGHSLSLPPVLLGLAWGALLGAGAWLALRQMPSHTAEITRIINITGGIALATCLYGVGAYGVHTLRVGEVRPVKAQAAAAVTPLPSPTPTAIPEVATQPSVVGPEPEQPPDIYYIILDGHGRSDVLNELFSVDNTPFINFLKKRGFTVAAQSRSNYNQTALSIASSLNYDYLDSLVTQSSETNDRGALNALINDSAVQRFVKAQGYRTVAFNNGFPATEMVKADTFYQDPQALNNFEMTLISGSLAQEELTPAILDSYRQRIQWAEGELEQMVADQSDPRPKFVFAHFILPHPPFVFNADGSARMSLDGGDGSAYTGTREDYYQGYREQVQYADVLAEKMIAAILDHSIRPPVIIIQGDHGSGLDLDWTSQENSCLRERFSILNAYYLPQKVRPNKASPSVQPYQAISPVNTFRVVFDTYFDAHLPLLPDRSNFALWATPYQWNDVTSQIESQCPVRPLVEPTQDQK